MRELDTLGIAYHSPALNPFCDKLRRVLTAVVPHPKERSKRWLSTCFPLDSDESGSRTCGPDYHVSSSPCLMCRPAALRDSTCLHVRSWAADMHAMQKQDWCFQYIVQQYATAQQRPLLSGRYA